MSDFEFSTNRNEKNIEPLAEFMNGYLSAETLIDVRYPENLIGDYKDFSDQKKKDWFEFTYHQLLRDVAIAFADYSGRSLSKIEVGLIKRRLMNYLKQLGYDYKEL
jgi:hypothetical protein